MFESYVEQVLVPQLRAGDVVIWDNLKPHKAKAVVSAVEDAGAQFMPLPPWSPDMTPIEEMFSKVKGALRSIAARTTETVTAAIGYGPARGFPAGHLGMVPLPRRVRYAIVNRSRLTT